MHIESDSKEYPYQGRDLFELPENYFYADCTGRDLLSNFISYLESIIKFYEFNKSHAFKTDISNIVMEQDKTVGNTYRVIHPVLKSLALKKLDL